MEKSSDTIGIRTRDLPVCSGSSVYAEEKYRKPLRVFWLENNGN
jgi:hypothetical protein